MKKHHIVTMILLTCLVTVLCGCGAQEKEPLPAKEEAQAVNPVEEMTAEEVLEATGISLNAPEGASDVLFSVIEGDSPIAQMTFTKDGTTGAMRVCAADIPENGLPDISGLHYEWKNTADAMAGYNDAKLYWNDGEAGYMTWYDFAPGLLYCVSMEAEASEDALVSLAELVYEPVQQ